VFLIIRPNSSIGNWASQVAFQAVIEDAATGTVHLERSIPAAPDVEVEINGGTPVIEGAFVLGLE
jgi:hypothetical protein